MTRPAAAWPRSCGRASFLVRADRFEAAGGWPGHFFYGHEGIDLAWRIWDRGYTGFYAADILVNHPATYPTRHAVYYRMNARNRVWLAHAQPPVCRGAPSTWPAG